MVEPRDPRRAGFVRTLLTLVVCAALLAAAAWASMTIFASEPVAQREGATRRSAALVETLVVERGTHQPVLECLGRVEPAREVTLASRVGGSVVAMQPGLVPGGVVRAGEPLLRIDPSDYERALAVRDAELRQIQAELAIEQGRQHVARQEFELLGAEIPPEDRALVLREPQIASLEARVDAAQAAVDQARLDLERTQVRAPFDAQVLDRAVDLGSQVSAGEELAHLVGIDEAWVIATLPARELPRLRFPRGDEPGEAVRVSQDAAWPAGVAREGRLERLLGDLDAETRLARVLVSVSDPLGLESGQPPLILGSIVQVELSARPLADVVRIARPLLRQGDTVWLYREGELELRSVRLAYRDAGFAYVSEGLEAGDEVVVTDLATVTGGLALRRATDPVADEGEDEGQGEQP